MAQPEGKPVLAMRTFAIVIRARRERPARVASGRCRAPPGYAPPSADSVPRWPNPTRRSADQQCRAALRQQIALQRAEFRRPDFQNLRIAKRHDRARGRDQCAATQALTQAPPTPPAAAKGPTPTSRAAPLQYVEINQAPTPGCRHRCTSRPSSMNSPQVQSSGSCPPGRRVVCSGRVRP